MATFYSVTLDKGTRFKPTTIHSTKNARDKRIANLQRQYGKDSEIQYDDKGNATFLISEAQT